MAKPLIEKLTESYLKILDKQVLCKSKCCKYEGKDRVDLAEATSSIDNVSSTNVENNNEDDEEMEDTSSGIGKKPALNKYDLFSPELLCNFTNFLLQFITLLFAKITSLLIYYCC